ncbi:MAG: hypothetical protein LBS55_10645 [Prevotellaceae bacterium]|jgi:hypothetical protein|nr:hypothetical protein [Prevotellaceae bacterium]
MKKIVYFISILLVPALYSCSGQYDNIDSYTSDESVYVGQFSNTPYLRVGYKRVEIELMGDSIGRAFSDDLYLGKAKKTVIEYDEEDGVRRVEFDSVCSWVNIKGLTTPKTYIFTIYAEDEYGNKSISTEALGKPYTDADFEGIAFPSPQVIEAPTTVEFNWESEVSMGLSSPLFKFVELIYSYVDKDDNMVSGKVTAKDIAAFNISNLEMAANTTVVINCRIIPVAEAGLILDTLSMVKEYTVKTATPEEYLAARTLRPIQTALINPTNESLATITFDKITDHLKWTEIRYKNTGGDSTVIRIENNETTKNCPDFERRGIIQIRCAYNPPETDIEVVSEWTDYGPFILRYAPALDGWSVLSRNGNHGWGNDGRGDQILWDGGHPMLILDDDTRSGWHSRLSTPFPQVLIIDMQDKRRISKIVTNGGYWQTVEFYLTDNLSIPEYTSHKVIWDDGNRVNNYSSWMNPLTSVIPEDIPTSWGDPIWVSYEGEQISALLPQIMEGQYLIVRFPDNNLGWATYICMNNFEVYSD